MNQAFAHILAIVERGGPERGEFPIVQTFFDRLQSTPNGQELPDWKMLFGEAFPLASLQGFVARRPYGFAGDFAIIDRIYSRAISANPALRKWDDFFQSQTACEAVRNRRKFLTEWLEIITASADNKPKRILSVASGPCREIQDYFERNESRNVHFSCLDQDPHAIAFAEAILHPWREKVQFIEGNALKPFDTGPYDIIYSSGLFDYLPDRFAIRLIHRLWSRLESGGSLLIGNFSPVNPSRAYMEFGGWQLIHRTRAELKELFRAAIGDGATDFAVRAEPLGVNLFAIATK